MPCASGRRAWRETGPERLGPRRVRGELKIPGADTHLITGGSKGSFSARGVIETAYMAYVMTPGPRGTHLNWLVLMNDHDELSPPLRVPGQWIMRVVDVDGDGVDELVMTDSNGTFTGQMVTEGVLVGLHDGRVAADPLGLVEDDTCGMERQGRHRSSVVFVASDGSAHRFRAQTYTGRCPIRDFGYGHFVELPATK